MLELGQKCWAKSLTEPSDRALLTLQDLENELGGVEGFFIIFGMHYCHMFANPRMNVLFDTRHADANVNAYEHGKRVAATFLTRITGTNYSAKIGRGNSMSMIAKAHGRSKKCPMRPQREQKALPEGHPRAEAWFTVK